MPASIICNFGHVQSKIQPTIVIPFVHVYDHKFDIPISPPNTRGLAFGGIK